MLGDSRWVDIIARDRVALNRGLALLKFLHGHDFPVLPYFGFPVKHIPTDNSISFATSSGIVARTEEELLLDWTLSKRVSLV